MTEIINYSTQAEHIVILFGLACIAMPVLALWKIFKDE